MTRIDPITPPSVSRNTTGPDFYLLEKVAEHDEVFDLCGNDDADDGFTDIMCMLEIEIASCPAFTAAGLAGKMRVIERAEFCPAVMRVVREILRQDRKRIAG
jgi:hypothetical protein